MEPTEPEPDWTWLHSLLGFLLPPYLFRQERLVLRLMRPRYGLRADELADASDGRITIRDAVKHLAYLERLGLVRCRESSAHLELQPAVRLYLLTPAGFEAARRLPPLSVVALVLLLWFNWLPHKEPPHMAIKKTTKKPTAKKAVKKTAPKKSNLGPRITPEQREKHLKGLLKLAGRKSGVTKSEFMEREGLSDGQSRGIIEHAISQKAIVPEGSPKLRTYHAKTP